MAAVDFTPASGSVAFSDGDGLDYATQGVYCVACRIGGALRDIRPVYAPGELGAGTQNFGGGTQLIKLSLIYVGSSETDCMVNFENDMLNLASGTFVMTINGSDEFNGCILGGEPESDQPKSTGVADTYRMNATVNIRCLRP